MKITTKASGDQLIQLAEALCGKSIGEVYKPELLLEGLNSEVNRLGNRRYLVLLTQKVYDIDGLTDYVYLLESFDATSDAFTYVDRAVRSLYEAQTKEPDEYRCTWQLESEGEIPYLTPPKLPEIGVWANPIRVIYDRTYKLRASDYDTQYNCFRVIGPFRGDIVSEQLFSWVNDSFELKRYFEDVGGDPYQSKLLNNLRWNLPSQE